jgi:transposase
MTYRQRNQEMLRLVLAGHTQREIATMFGISRNRVCVILNQLDPKVAKKSRRARLAKK